MKFYSEDLKELFDSVEDLKSAEKKHKERKKFSAEKKAEIDNSITKCFDALDDLFTQLHNNMTNDMSDEDCIDIANRVMDRMFKSMSKMTRM